MQHLEIELIYEPQGQDETSCVSSRTAENKLQAKLPSWLCNGEQLIAKKGEKNYKANRLCGITARRIRKEPGMSRCTLNYSSSQLHSPSKVGISGLNICSGLRFQSVNATHVLKGYAGAS